MKLDATDLRYLTTEEFRVLTAGWLFAEDQVEMGSKNHEVVPTPLISQISKLKSGGINKLLGGLAKRGLVSRVQNAKYDGYRLTYGGYDYLAIRALSKRDTVAAIGNQIGVGKESDIYIVSDPEGEERVLKLHRLGRVSFRAIKAKRDYLGKRKSATWMYMSRLAAQKEWAFMKILHEHGFPVPKPIDQARHCVLMEFIDAYPLRQISDHPSPGELYSTLMDIIVSFAHSGLIHGDFNEFNILIRRETGVPIVIDFPQMVSTSHANAAYYFNRDIECIRTFFKRRFGYESLVWPKFTSTIKEGEKRQNTTDGDDFRLDVVVAASGFGRKEQAELERFMEEQETNEQEDSDALSASGEESVSEDDDGEEQLEGDDAESPEESEEVPPSEEDKIDSEDADGSEPSEEEEEESARRRKLKSKPRPPKTEATTKVKDTVTAELKKQRDRQEKRYHSKKSVGKAGRAKGSKLKSDTRVKLGGDGWD